jgi:hypothetical protein
VFDNSTAIILDVIIHNLAITALNTVDIVVSTDTSDKGITIGEAVSRLVHSRGPVVGLLQGVFLNAAKQYLNLQFYKYVQVIMFKFYGMNSSFLQVLLSALASETIFSPLGTIRMVMVTESVKGNALSFVGVVQHILNTKGVLGFYSGLLPRYALIISNSIVLLSTDFIIQKYNKTL